MNLASPSEIIEQYVPIPQFINIFWSIFAAINLFMIYLVFKSMKKNSLFSK
jgi:hypothetical protein